MNFLSIIAIFCFLSFGKGSETPQISQKGEHLTISVGSNATYYVKKVGEKLNVTCLIQFDPREIKLSWEVPQNLSNRSRFTNITALGLQLTMDQLQESDSGEYKCLANVISPEANAGPVVLHTSVNLIVKSKRHCNFSCGLSLTEICISERFKCDGHKDCEDGRDEMPEICGVNPCENKIPCNDRCIPKEWCCTNELNCTHKWEDKCCPKFHKGSGHRSNSFSETHGQKYNEFLYDPHLINEDDVADLQHYNDDSFLRTTMFTLFSCATVVILFVAIMIVTIRRAYLKRVSEFNMVEHQRNLSNPFYHRVFSTDMGGVDTFMVRPERYNSPGLLVTYNINNGVQIVGGPVEPPPYSESVSPPPREGPPPPYKQTETLGNPSQNHRRFGLYNVQVYSEPALSTIK